ncbi:hypothetical protein KDA11_06180 [Candidatus Saccharibacteria bacterium]|nr:hypothetical protein [Candidatus Saccharibacteria bacterium]
MTDTEDVIGVCHRNGFRFVAGNILKALGFEADENIKYGLDLDTGLILAPNNPFYHCRVTSAEAIGMCAVNPKYICLIAEYCMTDGILNSWLCSYGESMWDAKTTNYINGLFTDNQIDADIMRIHAETLMRMALYVKNPVFFKEALKANTASKLSWQFWGSIKGRIKRGEDVSEYLNALYGSNINELDGSSDHQTIVQYIVARDQEDKYCDFIRFITPLLRKNETLDIPPVITTEEELASILKVVMERYKLPSE